MAISGADRYPFIRDLFPSKQTRSTRNFSGGITSTIISLEYGEEKKIKKNSRRKLQGFSTVSFCISTREFLFQILEKSRIGSPLNTATTMMIIIIIDYIIFILFIYLSAIIESRLIEYCKKIPKRVFIERKKNDRTNIIQVVDKII